MLPPPPPPILTIMVAEVVACLDPLIQEIKYAVVVAGLTI